MVIVPAYVIKCILSICLWEEMLQYGNISKKERRPYVGDILNVEVKIQIRIKKHSKIARLGLEI